MFQPVVTTAGAALAVRRPHFTVCDYVLVAGISRQGKHRKIISTWTGPWRVANDDKDHVYGVKQLVTAELRDVQKARMRHYADYKLQIAGELLNVFQQLKNQGKYHIWRVSAIKWAASGGDVVVEWPGNELRWRSAPGSRCRACSMTRRPRCAKSSRRYGSSQSRSGRLSCGMG